VQVATRFVNSSEFARNVGDPNLLTEREFTEELYQNFLQRPADPGGLNFWSGFVERGVLSRAELLIEFATSDELRNNPLDVFDPATGLFKNIENDLVDNIPGIQLEPDGDYSALDITDYTI